MNHSPPRLLESLGVSDFDEQVYRTLLSHPGITASCLATAMGVQPARVRPSLRRLDDVGFVGVVDAVPKLFVPALPDVAIESLVHARQQELLQVRTAALELQHQYQAGRRDDPGQLVEILTGQVAVAQRFAELQHACSEEMLLLDRPPYAAAPDNPGQTPALRRGVQWRTIYAPESLRLENAHHHVEDLVEAGEDARMLPGLPIKLVIVDRKIALLPLTLEPGIHQSAVIQRSTLLDAMVTLFDTFWERAVPVIADDCRDQGTLPEDDRRLLMMLVTGTKDESIARELEISVRTLRRRMHGLFRLLNAETRFQAGMQAARRGWI